MREIITNILLIALAIAFLVHLALIVKYDGYFIREPNPFILYSEVTGFAVIIGFGVYNIVKRIRSK